MTGAITELAVPPSGQGCKDFQLPTTHLATPFLSRLLSLVSTCLHSENSSSSQSTPTSFSENSSSAGLFSILLTEFPQRDYDNEKKLGGEGQGI